MLTLLLCADGQVFMHALDESAHSGHPCSPCVIDDCLSDNFAGSFFVISDSLIVINGVLLGVPVLIVLMLLVFRWCQKRE